MKWRRFNGELHSVAYCRGSEHAIVRETGFGHRLKVCIGTDSQVKGLETEFATTVIVFLREGHGGFMFIHNEKTRGRLLFHQRKNAGGRLPKAS